MSDTGEQGMNPKDPAHRAGIGCGVTPDDKTEGELLAALTIDVPEAPAKQPPDLSKLRTT